MADPKRKTTAKRTTSGKSAGGSGKSGKSGARSSTATRSKRYTPPQPSGKAASPPWVPATMFALLVCGALIVILNYLGVLPGEQQNRYLFLGLGEITVGFVFATRYR